MRKIKKLKEITLKSREMDNLKGGISCYDAGFTNSGGGGLPPPLTPSSTPTPTPPTSTPSCACGCAGCIWEDGGTGFSIGMLYNNLSV